MTDTVTGLALSHLRAGALDEAEQTPDPSFNARRYAREQGIDKTMPQELGKGWFDSATNAAQFDRLLRVAQANRQYKEDILKGHDGSAALNFAVDLLDAQNALSLVPVVGQAFGAGRIASIGAGLVGGALDGATQSAMTAKLSPDGVTPQEALMNIGVTAGLGAGLGAVFSFAHPKSPLRDPTSPLNDLKPDHLGGVPVQEQRLGDLPETAMANKPDNLGGYSDAGAAATRSSIFEEDGSLIGSRSDDDNRLAQGKGALKWIDDKLFGGMTPLGRFTHYEGPGATTFAQLTDLMGLKTKGDLKGLSRPPSAELLRTNYIHDALYANEGLIDQFRQANADLGQSVSPLADFGRDMVHQLSTGAADVNQVGYNLFLKAVDDIDVARSTGAIASAEPQIKAVLAQGLGGDAAKAEKVYGRAVAAVDHQQQFYKSMAQHGVDIGAFDPDSLVNGHYMPMVYSRGGIARDPLKAQQMFLQHVMDKPQDEFLIEHGYIAHEDAKTPEGQEPLPKSWDEIVKSGDSAKVLQIQQHWAGDTETANTLMKEGRLAEATRAQADAQADASDSLAALRNGDRDYRALNLKQLKQEAVLAEQGIQARSMAATSRALDKAKAKVDSIIARLGGDPDKIASDLRDQLQADGHQIDAAGAAAREAERAAASGQQMVDFLKGEKATAVAERATHDQSVWQGQRDAAHMQEQIDDLNQQLRQAYADRKAKQAEADLAKAQFKQAAAQKANTQEWSDAVTKEMNRLMDHEGDALLAPGYRERLDEHMGHLEELKRKLAVTNSARNDALVMRKLLRQDHRIAERAVDKAAWEQRKAAWAVSKDAQRTPAADWAAKTVNSIMGNERAPSGFLMDRDGVTGRLKAKTLNWSNDEVRALTEAGFRETNPMNRLERYASDVGGSFAIHRAFAGRGRDEVLREVQAHYQERIAALRASGDLKGAERLRVIGDHNVKDASLIWDKVRGVGTLQGDDPLTFTLDSLRHAVTLRYQGGFIFGAIGDIATAALAARGSTKNMIRMRAQTAAIVKEVAEGKDGAKWLARITGSMEHGAHLSFTDRAMTGSKAADLNGTGSGMTRLLTGKMQQVMNATSDAVNKASGLKMWTDGVRNNAALVQLANISDYLKRPWDKIPEAERAELTAMGIGQYEHGEMGKLFVKHAETADNGLVFPNVHQWRQFKDGSTNRLGSMMADVLETALIQTKKRASFASSFGAQPRLMSSPVGRLFGQFTSYAAQYYQSFVRGAIQHGAVTHEWSRTAAAMSLALAAGEITAVIGAYKKGGADEVQKLRDNPSFHAYQVIQRSGILGMAGSYVDSGVKLLAPQLKARTGVDLGAGQGKFSQNSWLTNLMGPWAGAVSDLNDIGNQIVNGDPAKAQAKAMSFIPMNQQFNLLKMLAGASNL